jgi:LCP family protein required for cell wall assembly
MERTSAPADHGDDPLGLFGDSESRPRRRWLRALLLLAVIGVLLTGGVIVAVFVTSENIAGHAHKLPDVFDIPAGERPVKPTEGQPGAKAINILLAGSDRRSEGPTTGEGATKAEWIPGLQRSDTMMILHISGDRRSAYLISIPRDSWVDIPGHGRNKLNAAFSFGGPSLYVRTIERLTGLRIDHLAVIDWHGFRQLTDALGGVTLDVRTADGGTTAVKMDGEQALTYVRERYSLPGGDFDRIKRQQHFLRALMRQSLDRGTVTNPLKLTKALDAVASNLTVDDEFGTGEMRSLALSARNLRGQGVSFMTAPVRGVGREGKASVVYLDTARCASLWKAVRSDDLAGWLARNPGSTLGSSVR